MCRVRGDDVSRSEDAATVPATPRRAKAARMRLMMVKRFIVLGPWVHRE